jgi:hypothetical protein
LQGDLTRAGLIGPLVSNAQIQDQISARMAAPLVRII